MVSGEIGDRECACAARSVRITSVPDNLGFEGSVSHTSQQSSDEAPAHVAISVIVGRDQIGMAVAVHISESHATPFGLQVRVELNDCWSAQDSSDTRQQHIRT
jgi:hypothetical protein